MNHTDPKSTACTAEEISSIQAEKCRILKKIHEICVKNEIIYFAVDYLAQAAENGLIPNKEEIEGPWTVAMMRNEFSKFVQMLPKSNLQLNDDNLCSLALRCAENSSNQEILIRVFDAVPGKLSENSAFLQQVSQTRNAYLQSLNSGNEDKELRRKLEALVQTYRSGLHMQMAAPILNSDGPVVNQALIYPVKNRKFCGIMLCVPNDCSLWTRIPREQEKEDMLMLIRHLHTYLEAHDIPYFAMKTLVEEARLYGDLAPDFYKKTMEIAVMFSDLERLQEELRKSGDQFQVYTEDTAGVPSYKMEITLRSFVREHQRPDCCVSVVPYIHLPAAEKDRKQYLQVLNTQYKKLESFRHIEAENKKPSFKDTPESRQAFEDIRTIVIQQEKEPHDGSNLICQLRHKSSKCFPGSFAFPVRHLKLNDFEICCPNNHYIWAKSDDIFYNEAVNAEKAELLHRLNKLLDSYHIESFAIADLLIGAVNYEDYVPNEPAANWDLALVRKEYERLLPILRQHGGEYGIVLNEFRDEEHTLPRATKLATLQNIGICRNGIRLIPFDRIPDAYDTQYAFCKKLRILNKQFKEITSYQITGKCKLSEKERRKIFRKYGSKPSLVLYNKIDSIAQTYNSDPDSRTLGRIAFEKSKFIPDVELYPLKQGHIRGVTVNYPGDYSVWTPVMDEDLHLQVTSIQQADFILIDKVDEICRKLGIGYFICGGSMLGYERNGGIIPWDDDIDVAMLRSDYDRFINEAEPLLDDRFFLQTRKTDPNIPYLFSKLRLNNTEYITKYNEHRNFHKGICLDLFPFDFIPNGEKEQQEFKKRVLKLSKIHNRIVNNQQPEPIDPVKPRNLKEYYYHGYGMLKRAFFWCHSLKKSQQNYLDLATSLNDQAESLGLTTVASFVPSYTYIKLEDLLPYQDAMFDGHRVMVPKCPDVFLNMQYGDYLQLPPKHQRVAHRLLRWSVDVEADREKEQKSDFV